MLRGLLLFVLLNSIVALADERPKVALVMAGGGAKGFAHIPVIETLDSLNIPIDYIVGTSIGGLVGALHSIGYSGEELRNLALKTDWEALLRDEPARQELPYFRRLYKGRYQIAMDMEGMRPVAPSGLIFGQRISLFISELVFPYSHIESFDHLPIPFRCVAVDLISGREVVFDGGSLPLAMRSTMSYPTAFSPVEIGDSLLVDGAVLNNFPTDVARRLGADIIIGADLNSPLRAKEDLRTALNIAEQSLAISDLARWKQQRDLCDVYINPDLTGFSSTDFFNSRIPKIYQQGKKAAREALPELEALKQQLVITKEQCPDTFRVDRLSLNRIVRIKRQDIIEKLGFDRGHRIALDQVEAGMDSLRETGWFRSITPILQIYKDCSISLELQLEEIQKYQIWGIEIEGNSTLPFDFIYDLLGLQPHQTFDADLVRSRIMEMYGLGYFETIRYETEIVNPQYIKLRLIIKERSMTRLRLGAYYNDQRHFVAGAGFFATNVPAPGFRIEGDVAFSGYTKFGLKISYPSRSLNQQFYPFLEYRYENIPTFIFSRQGEKMGSFEDVTSQAAVGAGFLLSDAMSLELALQAEQLQPEELIGIFPTSQGREETQLAKVTAQLHYDTLDDLAFPRRGIKFNARYAHSSQRFDSQLDYRRLHVAVDYYKTWANRVRLRLRGFYGWSDGDLPLQKYFNQGHPNTFVGVNYDQMRSSNIAIGRVDFDVRTAEQMAVSAKFNYAPFAVLPGDVESHHLFGFGLGLKYFSLIGPIEVVTSWGDKSVYDPGTKHNITYFQIGVPF